MNPAGPSAAAPGPSTRAGVASIGALWRFTRPHTIVGTSVSVVALYVIAAESDHATGAADLLATLAAAVCVNVAIVGLNQIEDLAIDRVNKPELPLPAGDLSVRAAQVIVAATSVAAVAMAITQGLIELTAVLVALVVGMAYSSPPMRLKRFPTAALLSISLVRGLVVNFGVYGHFSGSLTEVPAAVWALTAFVLPFSAAIAILKDVPDIEGDRIYRIRTFSVRLGPRPVFRVAIGGLAVTYLAMAVLGPFLVADVDPTVFAAGHVGALAILLAWARDAEPDDSASFTRFYMRVWLLFFFEYVLVALSAVP